MNKKGISLIVLVITIIIMIILATAVILTISNTNIINKAKKAVNDSNLAGLTEQEMLVKASREMEKSLGPEKVKDTTPGQLKSSGTVPKTETTSGNEEELLLVESIEDLVALSNSVNSGNTYEGKTIKLTKLLDFNSNNSYVDPTNNNIKETLTTGTGFTPIGTKDNPFKGTLDGDFTEIRNLYINTTSLFDVGLFGKITGATIKNIGITGNITVSVGENGTGIGAIVSEATNSIIKNCYSKTNIQFGPFEGNVGGICGFAENAQILGCHNTGSIIQTQFSDSTAGASYIGGICGLMVDSGKIDRCYNLGNITAPTMSGQQQQYVQIGGLVAGAFGDLSAEKYMIISNVYNTGTLTNATLCGGGIVSETQVTKIYNAYNSGNIVDISGIYSGAITGSISGDLSNIYSLGEIKASGTLTVYSVAENINGNVSNVYYSQSGIPQAAGNYTGTLVYKTKEEMKSQAFLDLLNSNLQDGWARWIKGKDGYPTLDI